MNCKGCGAQLRGNELFCPYCGTGLDQPAQQQQAQPQIHIHNHYQAPGGGYQQQTYTPPVYAQPQYTQYGERMSDKNRLVMFLLYFFLGMLGAHWFYTGHSGKGVLYLLTGGCCGVGLLIDFFVILAGTPRDSSGRRIVW